MLLWTSDWPRYHRCVGEVVANLMVYPSSPAKSSEAYVCPDDY
jgi:hypothetical protein